jgi:trimethylguanosine synthase
VFVADGQLGQVLPEWLRAPTAQVSVSDLEHYDIAACVCACSAELERTISTSSCLNAGIITTAGEHSEDAACTKPLPGVNEKHWAQRYRYFSRWDEGVCVDVEGWYSITPEVVAEHVARRVRGAGARVVLDAFCGCGGNAIAFARSGLFVLSIDIDPAKVRCARHNAQVYGVEDRIEFIVGDSSAVLSGLIARGVPGIVDAVCLAPPWGGPDYLSAPVFDLETMLCCPLNGPQWLALAFKLTSNVVMLVPRTVRASQLVAMARAGQQAHGTGEGDSRVHVEVEDTAVNYKVKMKVAYFGPEYSRRK